MNITLSTLGHTWILDLDGTFVKHNGYKVDGKDELLIGAKEFLDSIPKKDLIVWITSRKSEERANTEKFFQTHGIRYDQIIFDAPYGERILINDNKPSGLPMSLAIQRTRDHWEELKLIEDPNL